jgi:hypothetical protein
VLVQQRVKEGRAGAENADNKNGIGWVGFQTWWLNIRPR